MKLNAQELRELEEKKAKGKIREIKRNPIYFILENIYDTYNIGGIFRLADALAIEKMYLCGTTEIPPNTRIKKASIGTYKIVPWEYKRSSKEVIKELRQISNFQYLLRQAQVFDSEYIAQTRGDPEQRRGTIFNKISNPKSQKNNNLTMKQSNNEAISIIAVEQHLESIDYRKAEYRVPLALIFGNESYGILPETLKLADQIVEIPMWGINKSLNVIVSAAIVSYWLISRLKNKFKT